MTRSPWGSGTRLSKGWLLVVVLALAHGWAIWLGMGGRAGLNNGWPIWRDDHPLYFHSALITRQFLRLTGTTAGYDPSFMAGYAKSVIFPASSTLPELVIAGFGGAHPEYTYKLYVLASAAFIPWLVAWGACLWNARGGGAPHLRFCFTWSMSGPISRSTTPGSGCCRISWQSRWDLRPRGPSAATLSGGGGAVVDGLGVFDGHRGSGPPDQRAMVAAPAAALAYATAYATRERVPAPSLGRDIWESGRSRSSSWR